MLKRIGEEAPVQAAALLRLSASLVKLGSITEGCLGFSGHHLVPPKTACLWSLDVLCML